MIRCGPQGQRMLVGGQALPFFWCLVADCSKAGDIFHTQAVDQAHFCIGFMDAITCEI